MASHRSKSLYAIKECSTCGRLYTKECCSIGSLKDKILVPEPDSSPCCAKCGTPVDGSSCRGCAFLRKEFDERFVLRIVLKMEFSNTFKILPNHPITVPTLLMLFESHALSIKTPVLSLRKEPSQIDHNCALYGILVHQKFRYLYLDIAIKTINELPQILPSVHPTCNYEDENSFIYDSKPHSFNITPSVFNQPPQPQFETYLFTCDEEIDLILKEFAHIAPIPPGIVEADFDPNDDTSSDEDLLRYRYVDASLSYIEYDSFEEENEEQEEKEFDLEDILQIQDVILREKLLNILILFLRGVRYFTLFIWTNSFPEIQDFLAIIRKRLKKSAAPLFIANYSSFPGILDDGASCSIEVDTRESANTLALEAAAS
ncbi:hypothetical protein Tco_0704317 [Tanacetum coccineum]|uniref:Uncharacterized protein n=1 Tax=Tanacetum coccineum TaxID=301880 RepID=A0ABQ4Y2V0_9ASTR